MLNEDGYVINMNRGTKQRQRGPLDFLKWLIPICVVGLILLITIIASISTVPDGYQGILYEFGVIKSTDTGHGLIFHAPFIQRVERVDIRGQLVEAHASAYTSDGQVIEDVDYSLNYSYDTSRLDYIIRNIGIQNVESRLINPNLSSIMKNVFGKFKAEVLIQNRTECQEQMEEALREVLYSEGIIVNSFNLQDLDFEDGFEEAVRLKVEMEQKAQTAQNETVLRQEEANQRVIAAEAEAEAAKLAADAEAYAIQVIQEQLAASPNYVELIKVQQWDGHFPQIMSDGVNPFLVLDNDGSNINNNSD